VPPRPSDELPAGRFTEWLGAVRRAIEEDDASSDVPCGGCTACCTSSQFVHIEPDEVDTLAHVPRRLRFPAPGRPAGHVVLPYDERGRCPMLGERGCTIYAHRPRTCRTYDCRVFPAAGVRPAPVQVEIGRRTERWRFDEPTPEDRRAHRAVEAVASWLSARAAHVDPLQVAVRAVVLSGRPDVFGPDGAVDEPAAETALRALEGTG
jgi:hypothetical protein